MQFRQYSVVLGDLTTNDTVVDTNGWMLVVIRGRVAGIGDSMPLPGAGVSLNAMFTSRSVANGEVLDSRALRVL